MKPQRICIERDNKEKTFVIYPIGNADINFSNVQELFNIKSLIAKNNIIIKADKIIVDSTIDLNTENNFELIAQGDILFKKNGQIINNGIGSIYLKAGIENNNHAGKVIFEDTTQKQIINNNSSKIYIYYNPEKDTYQHKYHNPHPYFINTKDKNSLISYMLVNNVEDLQDINLFLHGNYALSSDIDASGTKSWNQGMGFNPIMNKERNMPFSGKFDGNNYKISNLYINRSKDNDIGLFGQISGQKALPCLIKDIILNNATVIGDHYVGILAGDGQYCNINNISINGYNLNGKAVVGSIIGTAAFISLNNFLLENGNIDAEECQGFLIGAAQHTNVFYDQSQCLGQCIGYDPHNSFEV